MPTSIAEQIRHVGEVLEELIVDVDVDEILDRADPWQEPPHSTESVTPRGGDRDAQRRLLMPAAAIVMVVALVGALWVVAADRRSVPADRPPTAAISPTATTFDPDVLTTIPAENLPTSVVLRVAVDTQVGRFEIYDHPGEARTSMFLRTPTAAIGGWSDNATIDEGLSWSLTGDAHEASRLVWGLAPNVDGYWIEVAEDRIEPDEHGIWYATIDDSVTEFTIHGPDGPVTIDANPEPVVATTTTPPSTPMSSSLCTDEGCAGFDPLPVAAGATDFHLGPQSLGDPIVHDEMFGTLTRCVTLSADFSSCDKIEGIAGVNLVSYPLDTTAPAPDQGPTSEAIRVGTTFTDLDPVTYATIWGPTQGNGPETGVTVRGHAAVRYSNEADPALVWQERPDVLVWVTVPADRTDDLMSIATIPFANYPNRYYSITVPDGTVETITWLDDAQAEFDSYTPTQTRP